MRVLIDKYVPLLHGVLDSYAEVSFLEPEQFSPAMVRNADALIIRTRTRCNAELLEGSRVQFIATATIGTDHIDQAYCQSRGIKVVSCPGCNAQAVCDYVEEAISSQPSAVSGQQTIGIVGVGHVGSKVRAMVERRGWRVVLHDPPLGLFGDLTDCDIITFHTPLTRTGQWPTYHMCDAPFLSRCKPGALIINAARGGVVDEQALINSNHPFILDTWEGEPNINTRVLDRALLASFHIAGYSVEGKRNASRMCLKALCEHFGLPRLKLQRAQSVAHGDNQPGWLQRVSDALKANPQAFEQLRQEYRLR